MDGVSYGQKGGSSMRTLDQVIEEMTPLIRRQISKGKGEPISQEEHELLQGLFDLFEEMCGLANKKMNFHADRVTLNLYEAIEVSEEDYSKITKRLLELSR
jgi:hypothetical protein